MLNNEIEKNIIRPLKMPTKFSKLIEKSKGIGGLDKGDAEGILRKTLKPSKKTMFAKGKD